MPKSTVVSVTALGLSGVDALKWAESNGIYVRRYPEAIFKHPDYERQRLPPGREFLVELVSAEEIKPKGQEYCTSLEVFAFARCKYGADIFERIKGELALLLRKKMSDADLKKRGFWGVLIPHEPCHPFLNGALALTPHGDGIHPAIDVWPNLNGTRKWSDGTAFAFPLPTR
jgi:hypothetical protein